MAATTKGSRADNSWEESVVGISEMGPGFIPKERIETLPSRLWNPTLPIKEVVEQANAMAGTGDLLLLVGMDMEVGEMEKMVGFVAVGVVGGGRERNRDVTAIEAVGRDRSFE